jgi:hypothetical protein
MAGPVVMTARVINRLAGSAPSSAGGAANASASRGSALEIAVGDDADERAAIGHRQMTDAAPAHEPQGLRERRIGLHGQEIAAHDVADQHGACMEQAICHRRLYEKRVS